MIEYQVRIEMSVVTGFHVIQRAHICAVVVTYFPKPEDAENLLALSSQVGTLLIVDNGSSPSSFAAMEAAARELDAHIVRLGSNLGIAAALNAGLRFARESGYEWLATFDQDSHATPGMIQHMSLAFASYPRPAEVAIIAPQHVDQRLGFTVRERTCDAAGHGWRIIRTTMTSGNLVRIKAAMAIGGFDDSLFIDLVDHDFCFNLRRRGYRVLEATDATLLHSLGAMERRLLIVTRVSVTNHPALRRYYMSRNRIILWRRHWRREPGWVLRDMRRFLSESLCLLLFENGIREKFRMVRLGIRDAFRDHRGPFRAEG